MYFFGPLGHRQSPEIFAVPTFSKCPNYTRKEIEDDCKMTTSRSARAQRNLRSIGQGSFLAIAPKIVLVLKLVGFFGGWSNQNKLNAIGAGYTR